MQTAPCPKCKREVMRDGAPGLLVCSCGQVLEFVTDLEGELNPAPSDKRWFGTHGELEDMHELGIPTPSLPSRQQAVDELEKRVAELQAAEAEERERRIRQEAELTRLLAPYNKDKGDGEPNS